MCCTIKLSVYDKAYKINGLLAGDKYTRRGLVDVM